MKNLNVKVRFIKDAQKRLLLTYEITVQGKKVSLQLTELMQFLYNNEQSLSEKHAKFLYVVSRVTKKFSFQAKLYYGIKNEKDMLHFLLLAHKHLVPVEILENGKKHRLSLSEELPISIVVETIGYKVICKLLNKSFVKKHPTHFLALKDDSLVYLYSAGVLRKTNNRIIGFLNRCLQRQTVIFDTSDTISLFLKRIYEPNKSLLRWEVLGDLKALIPEEITPKAVLNLNYDGHCLHPTLCYEYGTEIIDSSITETEMTDKITGRKMLRVPSMEDVFQQDLMVLFEENQLPFLLANPGDIAKFFDTIVPELKQREWTVNSNVTEFNVLEDPVTIDFEISSSDNNWFHFEPNCDINGERLSLQEISRTMVENQGYIKTKKGFAKLSSSTQEELRLLKHVGAFNAGKTFEKKEILPMMMMSKTTSTNASIKSLISDVNSFNVSKTVIAPEFQGELRTYQHYGVHWMNLLSNVSLGGVLADDMGLGKTVQTLAFTSLENKKGPVLVVCPTALLHNWKREIMRFLPSKTRVIYGGNTRRNQLKQLEKNDYVIVSYGILKNDIDYLKHIAFETILVDEAQFIKNPHAQVSKAIKQLNGAFKLVMTGTPIENHLQDIWNLFDFVMPDYLGSKQYFDATIKSANKSFLRMKLKPFILRREKREVLDSLPEKTEITLECPLSEKQMQLYQSVLDVAKKGVQVAKNKRNKLNMLTALLKLRQVCTHPGLVEEFKGLGIESAKFEMLKEKCVALLEEGHKVVVFSQFTSMLDIIQEWMTPHQLAHERLDGSMNASTRMKAVDRFQTIEQAMVFLVSLKAGGVGLNLTAADYVIHIDPWWNPATQAQATDRVHRMGQTNKVIVYKLICAGTIEEKIHQLQEEKRLLLSEIVDIDSAAEKTLDFDEIKSLILN